MQFQSFRLSTVKETVQSSEEGKGKQNTCIPFTKPGLIEPNWKETGAHAFPDGTNEKWEP